MVWRRLFQAGGDGGCGADEKPGVVTLLSGKLGADGVDFPDFCGCSGDDGAGERWRELGDILVNYSTAVQPGERVMIAMGEVESLPLTLGVYEAVIRAGGYPQVQFLSERLRHKVMLHGNTDQVQWVPEVEAFGMHWADVYLGLRGGYNLHQHANIPADVLAAGQHTLGKVSSLRWQQTRWCLDERLSFAVP